MVLTSTNTVQSGAQLKLFFVNISFRPTLITIYISKMLQPAELSSPGWLVTNAIIQ